MSATLLPASISPISAAIDAFARQRVTSPENLLDSVFQYNLQPLQWGTIVVGAGTVTHRPLVSGVELGVTAANADSIVFSTKRYFRYQSAKSQVVMCSAVLGVAKANVRRRMGYFDADDGIFLEQNGTTDLALVRRTFTSGAAVDNRVVQASWNLDRLDGTGPSLLTLNLANANLLVIDLQWLSVGRIRVGFDIGGVIVYAHQFLNANILTVPWARTANLPVRYEMTNTAASASPSTLLAICGTVQTEGGQDKLRFPRSANTGTTAIAVTVRRPVLSVRPGLLFNAITNRGYARPLELVVMGNADFLWELVYLPTTLTGAAFAAIGGNSMMERDIAATVIAGGDVVASGYKGTGSGTVVIPVDLEQIVLSLNPAGTVADIISIAITSLGGSVNTFSSIAWREAY